MRSPLVPAALVVLTLSGLPVAAQPSTSSGAASGAATGRHVGGAVGGVVGGVTGTAIGTAGGILHAATAPFRPHRRVHRRHDR